VPEPASAPEVNVADHPPPAVPRVR
jgi:hypothetical protein